MLTRWSPVRDLMSMRSDMDRLLENALQSWPVEMDGARFRSVDVDLYENDDEFIVKAELPGLEPDDVDINISGNTLTLQGQFQSEQQGEQGSVHFRERRYGSFRRAFTLPTHVEADKAEADFKNGVLTIRLPKVEEAKPKQIPVKVRK